MKLPPELAATLTSLFQNLSLLLSLTLIYTVARPWLLRVSRRRSAVVTGVIFGVFAIVATFEPVILVSGARFDGRSILIAICGAFGGPASVLVTVVMFLVFRFWAGATGVLPTVTLLALVSIAVVTVLAIWFYRRLGHEQHNYRPRQFALLGLFLALQSLSLTSINSPATAGETIRAIGIPLIVAYPIATTLIGTLLLNEVRRTKLESDLRESEQRFRQITTSINQSFSLRDADTGRILYISPAFETIWGVPTRLAYDSIETVLEMIHPDDRVRFNTERIEQSREPGYLTHYRIIRPDGDVRYIRSRSYPVVEADGSIHRVAGIAEDVTELMRNEEKLRESQHFVERIASTIPDRIFVYDFAKGVNVYANRDVGLELGYPPEQLLERQPNVARSLYHPDDLPRLAAFDQEQKQMRGGDVLEFEYRMQHASGEWRWFTNRVSPFQIGADGTPQQVIGLARDITERKRSEEELRQSQHFVERIVNTVPDAIFVHDLQRNINIYANHEVNTTLGYTPEQLQAMGTAVTASIFHPDDFAHLSAWKVQQKQLRDGETLEFDYRLKDAAGQWHWITSRQSPFQRDTAGVVTQVIGVARDVTERRQIEEELQQSQHFIERMANTVPDMFYVFDVEQMETVYANRAIGALLDYPEGVFATFNMKTAEQLIHPDDLSRLLPIGEGRLRLADGDNFEFEYRMRHASGEWRWVHSRENVFQRHADGSVQQVIGIARDITERKRSDEKLQRYSEALERNNQELEMFAYTASHDLQEPLRKIQAFGDRLQTVNGEGLSEQGKDYLMRMMNAANRMQTLIQDLLAYSRVTRMTQPFSPVALNEVADAVCSDLEVAIGKAGAQVEVGPLYTVEADPTQMRQLLQNLIGNALKFRAPDRAPVVTVSGRLVDAPSDSFDADLPYYELTVADNGIGFEEKFGERIFGMFQRLHGRNEYEGTGIGLAICRKIAERHHGVIRAIGRVGQGATFVVTIPVRQPIQEETSL